MISVTEHLLEKFHIEAKPGRKCICPECGGNNFSTMSNDRFGQCWSCGFKIYQHTLHTSEPLLSLSARLMQIFSKAFWARRGCARSAYNYLSHDRFIPDSTLYVAHVGEIPCRENIEPLKKPLEDYLGSLDAALSETKGKEREPLEEKRNIVQKIIENWDVLYSFAGALVLGYTDEDNNVVKIKIRKHWEATKAIVQLKFDARDGVFGIYSNAVQLEGKKRRPYLVEGDIDALQLATIFNALTSGWYIPVIASGGACTADVRTIEKVCTQRPIVVRDNDDAGMELVERIRTVMSVWVTTTPGCKDIAEFVEGKIKAQITAFKPEPTDAEYDHEYNKFLRGIYKSTLDDIDKWEYEKYCRSDESIKNEILGITAMKGLSMDQRHDTAATVFVREIVDRSSTVDCKDLIYRSGNSAYIRDLSDDTVYDISDNREYRQYSSRIINSGTTLHKILFAGLRDYIDNKGRKVDEHSVCWASLDKKFCMISMGNNKVLKITGDGISVDESWNQDHIFRLEVTDPWEYISPEKRKPGISIDRILSSDRLAPTNLTREQIRHLIRCWMAFSFIRDNNVPHPIIVATGPKESGKTVYAERITKTLGGLQSHAIACSGFKTSHDLMVAGTKNIAMVLDNIDGHKPWLEDCIAVMSTGADSQNRKLYTDGEMYTVHPDSALILTSMNATFLREDVGSRTLLINMNREESSSFEAEDRALIHENRSQLMSELVDLIHVGLMNYKHNAYRPSHTRMVEFANFCYAICPDMNWDHIFEKLGYEQREVVRTHDNLFNGLVCAIHEAENGNFYGITASELCKRVAGSLDQNKSRNWYYAGKPLLFANSLSRMCREGAFKNSELKVIQRMDKHLKTNVYDISASMPVTDSTSTTNCPQSYELGGAEPTGKKFTDEYIDKILDEVDFGGKNVCG